MKTFLKSIVYCCVLLSECKITQIVTMYIKSIESAYNFQCY